MGNLSRLAVVVMAHLKTQETSNSNIDRKKWKLYLARYLYERGYKRDDMIQLLKFIDWIMRLPEDLNGLFWQEIKEYGEGKQMPYLTSLEQTAMKKGMQQGTQKEAQRLLTQIINIKFKSVSENLIEKINDITDTDTLEILHHQAILCNSKEDFESKLNNIISKKS